MAYKKGDKDTNKTAGKVRYKVNHVYPFKKSFIISYFIKN
jgi:hypothetical protein